MGQNACFKPAGIDKPAGAGYVNPHAGRRDFDAYTYGDGHANPDGYAYPYPDANPNGYAYRHGHVQADDYGNQADDHPSYGTGHHDPPPGSDHAGHDHADDDYTDNDCYAASYHNPAYSPADTDTYTHDGADNDACAEPHACAEPDADANPDADTNPDANPDANAFAGTSRAQRTAQRSPGRV